MRIGFIERPAIRRRCFGALCWSVVALLGASIAQADNAAFDLTGPRLEVKVSRAGKSLPISQVPNLQPGDRVWIHPDFPKDQAARYLLIVTFLRGSTNPPPENWFTRVETWKKEVREEGVVVTVPQEAQQALIFLAPETGGDFSTLRSAVRSKPGVFVRASQDLNQASLDRSRLEKYLSDVRTISDVDPKTLHDRSILLARTLGIRLDQQCFERPLEQQAACLTQNTSSLVLDDGHSQSIVAALASGPNSDLIGAVTQTPLAGGGFYSAYVGAVVDLARVMGNMRSASYQYIPALAVPKQEQMNLKLNNPPSFRKPLSVIVIGLPAVESPQLPPLRLVDPKQVFCLQKSPLVLPVEGAPLVFSADIAHDFFLHVATKDGSELNLPARPEPASGGFVVDAHAAETAKLDSDITGTLRGFWGFEAYGGPKFHLRGSHVARWTVPDTEQSALIVGREDTFRLQGECSVCVESVSLLDAQGREVKTIWKLTKPDELEVKVALKDRLAGLMKLHVKQFALSQPQELSVQAYSEAARLESFTLNAGDAQGVLKGTRLDEVEKFEVKGIPFTPAKLSRANEKDELQLSAGADAAALRPEERVTARVSLKDGRVLELPTTIAAARPKITLLSKNIQMDLSSMITLGSPDELPAEAQISFVLKSEIPGRFPRNEKIEVATEDDAFSVLLNFNDGTLVLRDSATAIAMFDPRKMFGASAFGPLRIRPIGADGSKGDWQPLATLVRIPNLKELRCPVGPDTPCTLTGVNLFLIDSIASDPAFTHSIPVTADSFESKVSVPHPSPEGLYMKLRDDPSTTSTITIPVSPEN